MELPHYEFEPRSYSAAVKVAETVGPDEIAQAIADSPAVVIYPGAGRPKIYAEHRDMPVALQFGCHWFWRTRGRGRGGMAMFDPSPTWYGQPIIFFRSTGRTLRTWEP